MFSVADVLLISLIREVLLWKVGESGLEDGSGESGSGGPIAMDNSGRRWVLRDRLGDIVGGWSSSRDRDGVEGGRATLTRPFERAPEFRKREMSPKEGGCRVGGDEVYNDRRGVCGSRWRLTPRLRC